MRSECGVVRMIDKYKRQESLRIFKEILNVWQSAIHEEIGFNCSEISFRIDVDEGENQNENTTIEILLEHGMCSLQPNITECESKTMDHLNSRVPNIIRNFNQLLDCKCIAIFESSTFAKIEVQGISATPFEEGNW